MQNGYRWTVRNIDPACLDLLDEVKESCGSAYGELVSEAIEFWYHALPAADDGQVVLKDAETTRDGPSEDVYQSLSRNDQLVRDLVADQSR